MTRITFLGAAAAVLLACAPTVAQETAVEEPAAAPEATVANEVSEPASTVTTEETAAGAEAETAAATPGDPMVCKRGKAERHVNVVAPGANGRLCEVHYAKPTEGVENRVLWYATSDRGFCDERANNLMARLTSAGWSCANPDGTPVSIEASASAPAAAETVTAPESAPAEAEAPADPEEPADAPEAPEEPAEDGDQPD